MPTRAEIIAALMNPGIIAVIRAPSAESVLPICEALVAGGVTMLEITMTTPKAIWAISKARAVFEGRATVGVGTVTTPAIATEAIQAGAQFVVSPIARTSIVDAAHAHDKPVMLGAYTATEAQLVHEAGSDFVKLFPADALGPNYVKALRAPLPHLKIVPTGGVDLKNIGDWFRAGCAAVGVGSSLITKEILSGSKWDDLRDLAAQYVAEAGRATR